MDNLTDEEKKLVIKILSNVKHFIDDMEMCYCDWSDEFKQNILDIIEKLGKK